MARLPRLALAGQLHLVVHRSSPDRQVAVDALDRTAYVQALGDVARDVGVAVHGYTVLPQQVVLLLTPTAASAVSLLMQRVGRRHVGFVNRRHALVGSPWDGRYRVSIIQPERYLLDALQLIDEAAVAEGLVERADAWDTSSAAAHLGRRQDTVLTDHPAFWALGNTPFDREVAYRRRLETPLDKTLVQRFTSATRGGWALGDAAFLSALDPPRARPLLPASRGRPRRQF